MGIYNSLLVQAEHKEHLDITERKYNETNVYISQDKTIVHLQKQVQIRSIVRHLDFGHLSTGLGHAVNSNITPGSLQLLVTTFRTRIETQT